MIVLKVWTTKRATHEPPLATIESQSFILAEAIKTALLQGGWHFQSRQIERAAGQKQEVL